MVFKDRFIFGGLRKIRLIFSLFFWLDKLYKIIFFILLVFIIVIWINVILKDNKEDVVESKYMFFIDIFLILRFGMKNVYICILLVNIYLYYNFINKYN